MITQQKLIQLFDYNLNTGLFTRKITINSRAIKGSIAGSDNGKGYIKLWIDKKFYYIHRLAWLYVYGKLPSKGIDHIDNNPSNNKINNLRLANQSENMQNTYKFKTNTSGYKGVTWNKNLNKWTAQIWVNSKRKYLGDFINIEDAYSSYCEAAKQFHTRNKVILNQKVQEYTRRTEMKMQ